LTISSCANRADVRDTRADHRAEAILGGRKNTAHQHVANLGRRGVDDASDFARIDELFHRLATNTGGVENQAIDIIAQARNSLLHAGRGHAEHGQADGWLG
jgi:hypothetical protein